MCWFEKYLLILAECNELYRLDATKYIDLGYTDNFLTNVGPCFTQLDNPLVTLARLISIHFLRCCCILRKINAIGVYISYIYIYIYIYMLVLYIILHMF